jgi:hypothetical protein
MRHGQTHFKAIRRRHAVETEFLHPYTDVQYYTMVAVTSIAQLKSVQQQNQRKQSKRKVESDTTPRSSGTTGGMLMMIPCATSQKVSTKVVVTYSRLRKMPSPTRRRTARTRTVTSSNEEE